MRAVRTRQNTGAHYRTLSRNAQGVWSKLGDLAEVRRVLEGEVERHNSARHVARLIGIPHSTLRSILEGAEPSGERLDRIRRFAAAVRSRENAQRPSETVARETTQPQLSPTEQRAALVALYSMQEFVNRQILRVAAGEAPEWGGAGVSRGAESLALAGDEQVAAEETARQGDRDRERERHERPA